MFGTNYKKEYAKLQKAKLEQQMKDEVDRARAKKKEEFDKLPGWRRAMSQTRTWVIVLVLAYLVFDFLRITAPQPTPEQQAAASREEWARKYKEEQDHRDRALANAEANLIEHARAQLRDPESAKFSDLKATINGKLLCGYVNAKNGFGGYTGPQRFGYTEEDGLFQNDVAYKVCNAPKLVFLPVPSWVKG